MKEVKWKIKNIKMRYGMHISLANFYICFWIKNQQVRLFIILISDSGPLLSTVVVDVK